MFTTGSKFLIGASVVAVVATVVYGVTQGGALGTIGLTSDARRESSSVSTDPNLYDATHITHFR